VDAKKLSKKLSKFVEYILGRHPDEFGLVPDKSGYVKIKELLKAMHEETGWRHIRRAHLNEAMFTLLHSPFEIVENRIRAIERDKLPQHLPADNPPKLLFAGIRRRAYPVILKNGLQPKERRYIILAAEKKMALRIGKRQDQSPVLLTIQVDEARKLGTTFIRYGRNLYLAQSIPSQSISGPTLPKEKPEAVKPVAPEAVPKPKTPGSYHIDPDHIADRRGDTRSSRRKGGRKKEIAWKKERRQRRRKGRDS
jgi:putative RNA 2'-phosphotransferase